MGCLKKVLASTFLLPVSNLRNLSVVMIVTTVLVAGDLHAAVIHSAFSENTGTGGKSFAISIAGSREAYAESIASCDSRDTDCAASASALASTDYQVIVGASAEFYGATGLSVGDQLFIPVDVSYSVFASGNADASARIGGHTIRALSVGPIQESSGTVQFLLSPGSGVNVRLSATANASANSHPTRPLVSESYAWADPIFSISPLWEYAALADLIFIEEALDPVSLQESGIRPDGYTPQLPPGTALLSPVPIPAAVWLFGAALIGLFGYQKRNQSEGANT